MQLARKESSDPNSNDNKNGTCYGKKRIQRGFCRGEKRDWQSPMRTGFSPAAGDKLTIRDAFAKCHQWTIGIHESFVRRSTPLLYKYRQSPIQRPNFFASPPLTIVVGSRV